MKEGLEMQPYQSPLERGAVLITLDTEQIWGYLDLLDKQAFAAEFPLAEGIADKVLEILVAAGVSATWTVVGGMSLAGSRGPADARFAGLPPSWIESVPEGTGISEPVFYGRSFVERLRDAAHHQEIGLHGGITHLPWDRPEQPEEVLEKELVRGITALAEIGIAPTSFTFPRNYEAHHHLLARHGIRCYRGRGPSLWENVNTPAIRFPLRLASELLRSTPPMVMPEEKLPGLWNVPSSLFPLRMRDSLNRLAPLKTRRQRVQIGIGEAAWQRKVFHLWLHPENLAESGAALDVFAGIVDDVRHARDAGDIEVLTMTQVAGRMEKAAADERPPGRGLEYGESDRVMAENLHI